LIIALCTRHIIDNYLSILPISRGSYVIGEFETHQDFNQTTTKETKMNSGSFFESGICVGSIQFSIAFKRIYWQIE